MTTKKQDTGKLGEDVAVKYLEKHGYEIIERNYRKPWGEIDIVARETTGQIQELVFIEVKAQNINFEWRPEENVTFHKKHQLSKIVSTYLKEHRVSESQDWRIDVLALKLDFEAKSAQVEHIKNIMLS